MHLRLLPALLTLQSLPLMAWEAPAQNELAALFGEDPQATILQCGLPQVPTREEARRVGYRYELERAAMKRALLFRTVLAKSNRGRIFAETNAATAEMARQWGAPAAFCRQLELLASGELSRRQEYAAERALRLLVAETYGVDTLQMRLLAENLNLPQLELMNYMMQLPVGGMFDLVPGQPTPLPQVLGDIMTMTTVLRQANDILRTVRDARSADAAAARLQDLLPLWSTTQQTRYHRAAISAGMDTASQWAAQLLENTTAALIQTRRSLHDKDWYGSTRLEAIDELLR